MTFDLPAVIANVFGPEALVVLAVVVLLFGGSRIPKLARSLGQASKEFKEGQDGSDAKGEQRSANGGKESKKTES